MNGNIFQREIVETISNRSRRQKIRIRPVRPGSFAERGVITTISFVDSNELGISRRGNIVLSQINRFFFITLK